MGSEAGIADLLVEKYGVDRSKITPEATMSELGLDSLSVAELLFDIEDRFSIEIDVKEVDFQTYGEAVAMVDRLRAAQDGDA